MIHLDVVRAWLHVRVHHERGASLVEYALLVALIALVCFAAVQTLGGNVSNKYSQIGSSLS